MQHTTVFIATIIKTTTTDSVQIHSVCPSVSIDLSIYLSIYLSIDLSIYRSVLTTIFQVNLGQPVPIEAKDDGGGGDNWTTGAISRAKLHPNHHHQQTNILLFYRSDALPVAQPTVSNH